MTRLIHRATLSLAALMALTAIASAADPTSTAQGATDTGVSLIYQYGPWWGGMALVFGLFSSMLAKNESQHWIAQGRTLAALVAGLGIAGVALQAHFAGTPWAGVAVTAVMALFKLMQPTVVTPVAPAKPMGGAS